MADAESQIAFQQLGLGDVLRQSWLFVSPNQREYAWTEGEVISRTRPGSHILFSAAVFVPLPDSLPGMASGGAVADFDRNGWQDLFFVSGGGDGPDRLYRNNGDGTFSDRAEEAGLAVRHRGLGAAAGDYDGDGWIDLYVVSYGPAELPAARAGPPASLPQQRRRHLQRKRPPRRESAWTPTAWAARWATSTATAASTGT